MRASEAGLVLPQDIAASSIAVFHTKRCLRPNASTRKTNYALPSSGLSRGAVEENNALSP